jgi:hypothetical protein
MARIVVPRRCATIAFCTDAKLQNMLMRLLIALVVLIGLAVAYFWLALTWSYSSGERAGWVQKFSNKGWVCKTWEGEVALVSLPGSMAEKFFFTVHDAQVAKQIQAAMGKRVTLHYEEKVGLPTTCFGETRHFVTSVSVAPEFPMSAGAAPPAPPVAAPASAPPTLPAQPPAPAASR